MTPERALNMEINGKERKKGKINGCIFAAHALKFIGKELEGNPDEDKSSEALAIWILVMTVFDIVRICQELKLAALRVQISFF